jgi:hypothetical protein
VAEGLPGLLFRPKVLLGIGAIAGFAFIAHELPLPFTHGSSDSDPEHAKTDKSVINCATTPKQEFELTEVAQEIKAERVGHVETLGYFAVKSGKVIHAWDSDVKTMAPLGKTTEVRAYNGKFTVHANGKKAQATVTCPSDQHAD